MLHFRPAFMWKWLQTSHVSPRGIRYLSSELKVEKAFFRPEPDYENRARTHFEFLQVGEDVYSPKNLNSNLQISTKAAFGGLVFAQCLAAAEQTVSEEFKPHSLHSSFILNINTTMPLEYRIHRKRDGKSFATRTVEAVQNGRTVHCAQISFHKLEPDAMIHQDKMPQVAHWSELEPTKALLPKFVEQVRNQERTVSLPIDRNLRFYNSRVAKGDLFESRPADPEWHYALKDNDSFACYNWFRASGDLGDDERLHRYLVAYNTDTMLSTASYRPHFRNALNITLILTLDHVVHLHKHDVRADEWILYENNSHYAGKGRTMTTGRLWTEDGQLIATVSQEVLVRAQGLPSRC